MAMPSPIAVEPSRSRSASTAVIAPRSRSRYLVASGCASSRNTCGLVVPASSGTTISALRISVIFMAQTRGRIGFRGHFLIAQQLACGRRAQLLGGGLPTMTFELALDFICQEVND